MSWLSSLTNGIGSIFGDSSLGDDIGGALPNFGSSLPGMESGAVPGVGKDPQKGGLDTGFYSSLLQGGLGLAGTYFQQSQNKSLAEAAGKQRMAEIEAAKEAAAMQAGAIKKAARINSLTALYDNYAGLTAQGGQIGMQGAIDTGKSAAAPIIARAGRL